MADLIRCILGPQLYRTYSRSGRQSKGYEPGGLEKCGSSLIQVMTIAWSVCYSTSTFTGPVVALYLFRKGFFSHAGLVSLSKMVGSGLVLLAGACCVRGYGRFTNPEYRAFVSVLEETSKVNSEENKKKLGLFDFYFNAWPVDYTWNESLRSKQEDKSPSVSRPRSLFSIIRAFPCDVLRYFVATAVGRPLIYPGSTKLLQSGLGEALLQGRTALLEKETKRAKLLASDGNEIDTVFIDKRFVHPEGHKGNTLVITCEGNAGFYEVGLPTTPLKAGYSVLGWNHPGFAGSTGLPYPDAEQNAMAVVLQYAVHKLGFPMDSIVLYAWSIGGYPATWAGMTHPDLGGLVLDATFDDLVPLAQTKMPESIRTLTTQVIKEYFPLDNAKQLCRYQGPVLIIRRLRDEMITTEEGDVSTNRGNDLLIKLLKFRYPFLLDSDNEEEIRSYLAAPDQQTKMAIWNSLNVDPSVCASILKDYITDNGKEFPMMIGQNMSKERKTELLMFVVVQYLLDFDATHCIPLPSSEFRLPWKH